MSSIDNANRVKPITPIVHTGDRQERYHEFIARRYREEAERDRQIEEAKNADIHTQGYKE